MTDRNLATAGRPSAEADDARRHRPGGRQRARVRLWRRPPAINAINEPVFLPGHLTHYVRVEPGDFIFGDNDGVQLIPRHLVDEVLLRVEEIFDKENRQRELIAGGMPVDEVYHEFGVL